MEARVQITTEELERLKTQPEVLVAIIREQARLIEKLRKQNGQLGARVREFEEQNRPPYAPFRRKRVEAQTKQPGNPGRRKGHKADWKKKPEVIDEHVDVTLAPECPCCASRLQGYEPLDQYIGEIIPAKKHVTRLRTCRGWSPKCGQAVASTHTPCKWVYPQIADNRSRRLREDRLSSFSKSTGQR